jgi:hypothetical protein
VIDVLVGYFIERKIAESITLQNINKRFSYVVEVRDSSWFQDLAYRYGSHMLLLDHIHFVNVCGVKLTFVRK